MNIRITLTKQDAIKIYNYIFDDGDNDLTINKDGRDFLRDLLYPLTRNDGEQRDWLFRSGSVIWFTRLVKRDAEQFKRVIDEDILQICRHMVNKYIDLMYSLVPGYEPQEPANDPKIKYMDHDKQPGVDPWEDNTDPKSPEATSRPAD